jgi:putative ABC transport system permease protein
MKVSNNAIIRRLTLRSLKAGKLRNIVAVIAIALTAVLFTAIFTLGGNMLASVQDATMRQVGTGAHASAKLVTREEYDRIAAAPSVRGISYNIIIGVAENDALKKSQTEIRYSEDDAAKWGFSYPESGHMPQGEREIACSTISLDLLGIPHELGAPVRLEFSVGGEKYAETFTLSGYWEGDPVMMAQQAWVSRAYADKVAPTPTVPFLRTGSSNTEEYISAIAGYISANIWFANSINIEGKVDKLLTEAGFSPNEVNTGINWAYMGYEIDPAFAAIVGFVLLLILLSGYLIIYSVFTISVTADIHFFGLLKTIGTTGKQLRRIIRGQALILSAVGIPLGLALGWLAGNILTPVFMSVTTLGENFTVSANPSVFAFAAVFSLITVFVSCLRPGRIAAKVSPVEAVRFTGQDAIKRRSKRSGEVTPPAMAWANVRRNPKKLAVIVLSLSLSMILLNSVVSAVRGFDMNEYLPVQIVSDFAVADATVFSPMSTDDNYEGITADFLDELAEQRGVTGIGHIYFKENTHELTELAYDNALLAYDAIGEANSYYTDAIERVRESRTVPLHIYGVNTFAASKITASGKPVDFNELEGGNYVLATPYTTVGDTYLSYYAPGDKIVLDIGTGVSREYTVLDYAEMPYTLGARHGHFTDVSFIMSEQQFAELYGETGQMLTVYDAGAEYIPALEQWTENYCVNVNSDLDYASRATYAREFENLSKTYLIIGGALSFILALIGILNFTNSQVTSIFVRRRELATLQSIGLTGKQTKRMLFFEGVFHAALTVLFTVTVGFGIGYLIMQTISGQMWFFKSGFTLAPSLYCVLPLLAVCAAVPLACYRCLSRESVVERLRME